jgi:hypothetical protein
MNDRDFSLPTPADDPMRELARRIRRRNESAGLRPLTREAAELAASSMADPDVGKWLDFGGERQALTASALYFMSRSQGHVIRSSHGLDGRMFAVSGLYGISKTFKSAMVWGVRLRPPVRANGALELRRLMAIGFEDLGLASIYSNVAETNRASLAVTAEAGLKRVGRRRDAHIADGVHQDRVIFDIVASEFFEQEERRRRYLLEEETGAAHLHPERGAISTPVFAAA